MDAGLELVGERCVNHAVTFEPALAVERRSYDRDPEMGRPARPMPGMARMQGGFVHHVEPRGREGFGQSFSNALAGAHASGLEHFQEKWNPVFRPDMRQRRWQRGFVSLKQKPLWRDRIAAVNAAIAAGSGLFVFVKT
jgi:hypothetical protein